MDLGRANRRGWQHHVWDKLFGDHSKNALSGHDIDEDAYFCLERPMLDGIGHFCLSYFDGDPVYADVGSLSRYAFFYRRRGWKSHDVHQLDLGLGPS